MRKIDKSNYGKISIIIPIYNLEKYLKKCVNSVINQTYTNIEIILIDDGSTDGCGKICDDFEKMDSRVIVIHKKNEGVAVARNLGIKIATGKYIGFVDADDWIESTMYENLIEGIYNYNADISICRFYCVKNGKNILSVGLDKDCTISKEIAMGYLVSNRGGGVIQSFLWDKLFKKELFDGIELNKDVKFEDQDIMYKLFYKANRFAFINKPGYFYLDRDYSRSKIFSLEGELDFINVNLKRFYFIKRKYPIVLKKAVPVVIIMCLNVFRNVKMKEWNNSELIEIRRVMDNVYNRYNDQIVQKNVKIIPLKVKILYNLFKYLPRGYKLLFFGWDKIIGPIFRKIKLNLL